MRATITDVDQRYSLKSKSFSNFLTFELPSGRRFQVPVDEDVVEVILGESNGNPTDIVATNKVTGATTTREQLQENWEGAFADPQQARLNAMEQFEQEIAPYLSAEEQESQGMTPAEEPELFERHVTSGNVEWEKLPDTQLPPQMKQILKMSGVDKVIPLEDLDRLKAQIAEKLAKKPKKDKVTWNAGGARSMEAKPRKSVPKDDYGNPLPPGGVVDHDPGEVLDTDEDGVQQA